MKDLDKDFGSKDKHLSDDHENKYSDHEVIDNVQDIKDSEEGIQANKEIPEEKSEIFFEEQEDLEKKEETAPEEDQATEEKGQDPAKEGQGDKEEAEGDQEKVQPGVNKQFSSCYTPPYYVPNFTVNNGATEKKENEVRRSNSSGSWKMLVLLSGVLVCIFAAFLIGALSSSLLNAGNDNDETADLEGEIIEIVQNTPQVNITETTDGKVLSLPAVVQKVGNSVVEISTSSVVTDRFFGQYVTSGAGSGVIITQSNVAGYLITNHHVIEGAEKITVRLTNKEEYEAEIINSTAMLDLALLRIEKKADESFTTATIGDSSKLVVGQEIVAIGNPLGSLGGTVTNGIISALDRSVSIDGISMTLLQHNAAINPGNSGGALFDMAGNLVGIVNAKTSETGIEGLGFAIPVNIAFEYFKGVMNSSSIGATVDYGYNSKHVYGVYVVSVTENSQFKLNDRIVKINDTEINTLNDYYATVDEFKRGDTVKVTISRRNIEVELTITLQ